MSESLEAFGASNQNTFQDCLPADDLPPVEQKQDIVISTRDHARYVVEIVAEVLGENILTINSPCQMQRNVRPRYLCYAILLHGAGWSSTKIGAHFRKDHTTILSGIGRASVLLERDADYKLALKTAVKIIGRRFIVHDVMGPMAKRFTQSFNANKQCASREEIRRIKEPRDRIKHVDVLVALKNHGPCTSSFIANELNRNDRSAVYGGLCCLERNGKAKRVQRVMDGRNIGPVLWEAV